MAIPIRYGKILEELSMPHRQVKDGVVLSFEMHEMCVSHHHWLLGMFCLISLRPIHEELIVKLWSYIRHTDKHVRDYIYSFAQDTYLNMSTTETGHINRSRAKRRKKNPAYKGEILAINMKTRKHMIIVGVEELRTLGFNPSVVYNIINKRASCYTHNGHTFVRLEDS